MILRWTKKRIKQVLATTWGWRTFGATLRRPGVIVLMYHRIGGHHRGLEGLPVEIFEAQMRWVSEHCDPIRPENLVERARRPNRVRPAVLITFDDGYRDYHDLAYPVLKRLGIPATVFVVTSLLDEGGMLWTDEVQWAALSTRRNRIGPPWSSGPAVALDDDSARKRFGELARSHLKKLPNEERRMQMARLLAELGAPPLLDRQMLTWDEVRRTRDLTHFGAHTHTHPILSRVRRDEAEREIRVCRDRIAAETGQVPTTFAYPSGRPVDYTGETREVLRSLGFSLAFSTKRGIAGPDSDWLEVQRLPGDVTSMHDFAWTASGLSRPG